MGTVAVSTLPTATVPDPNADTLVVAQGGVTKKMGVGQVGGLLTVCQYRGGTSYTTSSGTFADVDATNLKVTFVAPPSGIVAVALRVLQAGVSGNTSNPVFNLRDGGGDIAGTVMGVTPFGYPTWAQHFQTIVTGLTPGTSYTWKLGWKAVGGTGQNETLVAGTAGSPTMVVWALPG